MMKKRNLFKTTFLFLSLFLVFACSSSDDELDNENSGNNNSEYSTKVLITDAPVDNAEVEAVFITIADVQVNGKSLQGFQKTSLEISSFTNGNTQLLGELDLQSGTTSSIKLVLDNTSAVSGEDTGNYVLTTSGEKKSLATSSIDIILNDQAEIEPTDGNELVLDFDLRKAIVMDTNGNYSFVNNSKLAGSIRAVNSLNAGTIKGNVSNIGDAGDGKIVAFAYKKGTYSNGETQAAQGEAYFSNAVTSSVVSPDNGEFELHFIESGDYELHFASFSDSDNNGKLSLDGELTATSATDLNLLNLSVNSNSEVSIEVIVSGFLGL